MLLILEHACGALVLSYEVRGVEPLTTDLGTQHRAALNSGAAHQTSLKPGP